MLIGGDFNARTEKKEGRVGDKENKEVEKEKTSQRMRRKEIM